MMYATSINTSKIKIKSNIDKLKIELIGLGTAEFISQMTEGAIPQSAEDMRNFSTEFQSGCDLSNQIILEINEMKAIQISTECTDSIHNMTFSILMYVFMTDEHIISLIYHNTFDNIYCNIYLRHFRC